MYSNTERRLLAEQSRLAAENRRLRDMLAPPGFLPTVFKLTDQEERAFKALLSRDQWTRESLLASMYLDANERDIPDIRNTDSVVCKLRRKLEPFGIAIETYYGQGFRISPGMRARAALLIDREHEKDALASRERTERLPSRRCFATLRSFIGLNVGERVDDTTAELRPGRPRSARSPLSERRRRQPPAATQLCGSEVHR